MVTIDAKSQKMIDFVSGIIDPVYIVGGCVRDLALNKTPHDYDFCTPLMPDQMEERIREKGRKPIDVGKKFGTLGIHYEGVTIEVTSFRKEQYKPGCRKPDVEFVGDITQDLSRRDFTINSMALRMDKPSHIIDPFEGQKDLENKLIKSTGNPTERFKEDPLRMLRACRFASQLGFDIEAQTFKKMKEHAHSILGVSKERWSMELDKLLMGDYVAKGLDYMFESDLFNFIIPEIGIQHQYDQNSQYHNLPLDKHTTKVVELCPKDLNLRWAALLHDVGKPFMRTVKATGDFGYFKHELVSAEIADHIALYLRWSNDRREVVNKLVLNHMDEDSPLRKPDMDAHL